MKKLSLILISLLVSFVPTFGIADYFEVTEIGSSAQSIRIGNIEGFSSFSNSIFENPAGLYRLNKVSGTLFTSKLMNEVNYLNGSIAYRFKFGVLAFGYFDASVSGIPFTEEVFYDDTSEFEATSYFNSTNSLMKVALQFSQSDTLHWGISGSLFKQSIYTTEGNGMNIDAGLIIDSDPLMLSISLKNVMSSMKVEYTNGGKENLPLQTVGSMRYTLSDLQFYGQFKTINSNRLFLKSAGISYRPSFLSIIEISGGYREVPVLKKTKSRLNGGVGLELTGLQFDYAFEIKLDNDGLDLNEFNQFHYFSFGFKF